jgi:hypothetical protein
MIKSRSAPVCSQWLLTGDIARLFVPVDPAVSLGARATLRDDTGMKEPLTRFDIDAGGFRVSIENQSPRDGSEDMAVIVE